MPPELAAGAGRWAEHPYRLLPRVARRSIEYGVRSGRPLPVDPREFPPELREPRASFVTLHEDGVLRGCIGALEPRLPLVVDVAENAFQAAFEDPRFPPVRAAELPHLEISVSVLSPLEPVPVESEEDLLRVVRPGVDGLLLVAGPARGTFLPDVWESLPDPRNFVRELKRKAGLPPAGWPPGARVYRYTTEVIKEEPPA